MMSKNGEHLGIYHIGTTEEVSIADLARRIATQAGREIDLVAGKPAPGGTARRCPDISKLGKLGYKPRVTLSDGLKPTLDWYWRNVHLAPG
jgi:nucleoside-diphosphate-sugar epimerase